MAARRSINLDSLPELVSRHKAGASLRALVIWLKEQGCTVSVETVRTELAKAGQAAEKRPELVLPDAEPDTIADRIKALRYEVSDERREARKVRGSDWKRYQGAIRLTLDLIKMDARPAGTEKPADAPVAEPAAQQVKPRFLVAGKPVDLPS